MDAQYHTLKVTLHRFAEGYRVELFNTDPQNQAQVASQWGDSALDLPALLALEAMPAEYGKRLAEQVFHDPLVRQRFFAVEAAAQATQSFLRFVLSVDPSAQNLQALHWELLRHPQTDTLLSVSETTLFSRFMVSRDFRPVKLRPRGELVALVAVSAPPRDALQGMGLAPVDFTSEVARVKVALDGVKTVHTLGGTDAPVTVARLLTELRKGVDILYLVSHGTFGQRDSTPALVLQDDSGNARVVKGEELVVSIQEMQECPRLVVLVSCQSAGDGKMVEISPSTTVQATLASRLADAGVPAVVAMQGNISMQTVETMMPAFFSELLKDGQVDRALAVARSKVRGRGDMWMPALYMRLTTGCLWYTPGFRGYQAVTVWDKLLPWVHKRKIVPILGPRLLEAAYGDAHDTARRLAIARNFPFAMHEWEDLPRVTEYLSVKMARNNAVEIYKAQLLKDLTEQHRSWLPPEEIEPLNKDPKLGKLLKLVGAHLREKSSDVYRLLAQLPASVYVTTNFDPLLQWALEADKRKPHVVHTRWRCEGAPESADVQPIASPTASEPLVYHVFGAFGANNDKALVLTEDDYFDYLISTAAYKLVPPQVESALVDNSLLFLGFRLTDWHFRVLFRLMMNIQGRDRLKDYCHVAVQLDPDMQTMADVEGAKVYLAEYFGKEANIDIYWGKAEDFLGALYTELSASGKQLANAKDVKENDDEWT